jgi:hypothetical protein
VSKRVLGLIRSLWQLLGRRLNRLLGSYMSEMGEAAKVHGAGAVLSWRNRLMGARDIGEIEPDFCIVVIWGARAWRAGRGGLRRGWRRRAAWG